MRRRTTVHTLTTPDLVLLSLLAEQPMHGYQANRELERRHVRDWAGISRPQVYYSLKKLARLGWIHAVRPAAGRVATRGPAPRIYATTARGRRAQARALARPGWTTERPPDPFCTWMALSWLARPSDFRRQLVRRRRFLTSQIARERATLRAVLGEVGHRHHEAVWVVSLMIEQFQLELRWLKGVERSARHRGRARNPQIVSR